MNSAEVDAVVPDGPAVIAVSGAWCPPAEAEAGRGGGGGGGGRGGLAGLLGSSGLVPALTSW